MEKTTHLKFSIFTPLRNQGFLMGLAILFVVGLAASPVIARAATLYFSPSSGSHAVGAALSVNVYVSSADQAMNAASGVISFPRDKLEVTSLSKTGSIFTLWVQEPLFSNSAGTVNFEGIVLNPGFTGATGKIIAINFRVKTAGAALLNFSSGSALANDGKGTNILTSLANAQFSLGGAAPVAVPVSGAPSAPQISSPTHPDPNQWHAKEDAKFTWTIHSGVTGVRLLANEVPVATPNVVYAPAISEREVPNLADGVWYFHAQFRNAKGWGESSHFRFNIDTQRPEYFNIEVLEQDDPTDKIVKLRFDAFDKVSGIGYYEIKIGGLDPIIWREGDIFETPPLSLENNLIVVKAADRAGNFLQESVEVFVQPVEESPIFGIGADAIVAVVVAAGLLALASLLVFMFVYVRHQFFKFKAKLRKEVNKIESDVHRAFDLLKEDIREQIKLLEKTRTKRQLTEEEEKIVSRLKKHFDEAEKFIEKEIKDIGKETK